MGGKWLKYRKSGTTKLTLVVFLVIFSLFIPLSTIAYADVQDCSHWWGWDIDNCLVPKTRSLLNITPERVSDEQLKNYIEQNTDSMVGLLAPLDHGKDVAAFLYSGSLYDAKDAMQDIVSAAYTWVLSTFITGPLMDTLTYYADDSSLTFMYYFTDTLSQANDAHSLIGDMLKIISVEDHRQLLDIYVQDRRNLMTEDAAWQDLKSNFQEIINYIVNTSGGTEETLRLQFNYDYICHQWWMSLYKLRTQAGNHIVARIAPPTPVISQTPLSGSWGTTSL